MSFSNVAKLGAGSVISFEDPANPGVYLNLEHALSIGQVGEQGEFVEVTPISKTVREYIRGLETPPQKQLTFNDVPADANYQALLAQWDDKVNVDKIKFRVVFTNGRQADFDLIPSGRVMEEAQGSSQLQMILFSQQSGATAWGEAA